MNLKKYADEIGLTKSSSDNEEFIEKEAKSRYFTEQIIWGISKDYQVEQMPLYNDFDVRFVSGGTLYKVESKVREYDSKKYDDFRISAGKCDFDNAKNWMVIAYFNDDKKWYLWDINQCKPKFVENGWRHWKYTASHPNNYIVEEDCWVFDFDKAYLTGKLEKTYKGVDVDRVYEAN